MSVSLLTGGSFKNKIVNMSGWSKVTSVIFCDEPFPDSNTIDLSLNEDGSVKGWIENDTTLKVSAEGEIITTTSTKWMFDFCSKLQSIDLGNLDTTNVGDASFMFEGCSSLTTLNLSTFKTENWDWAGYIFTGCSSLTTLDLRNWDLKNVVDADYMFRDCSSLETIYTDGDWTGYSVVRNAKHVFTGCTNLPNWESSKITGEYCKYVEDGGYFTKYEEEPDFPDKPDKPDLPDTPPDYDPTDRTLKGLTNGILYSLYDITLALYEKGVTVEGKLRMNDISDYIDSIELEEDDENG